MKQQMKAVAVAAAVAATVVTISATAALAQPARTSGTSIRVRGGEFFFKLSATSARRGTIDFVFKNVGHVGHDFTIAHKKTPVIQPGQTATLLVKLAKPGKYPYSCTVAGHAQAGMRGVFKVT